MTKKIVLIIFCASALAWSCWSIYPYLQSHGQAVVSTAQPLTPPPEKPDPFINLPVMDVDALAARMNKNQDAYQKLRDEALAVYAKRHPTPTRNDEPAKTVIRLAAYLWVWGDYYEEELWTSLLRQREAALYKTDKDPLVDVLCDIHNYEDHYSQSDESVTDFKKEAEALEQTEYPDSFKEWAYMMLLGDVAYAKRVPEYKDSMTASFAQLPGITSKVVDYYRALIKARIPNDLLFEKAKLFFSYLCGDADVMRTLDEGFDQAFEQEAPDSATRIAVNGRFYVYYAWDARGSGWANTVTPEGWKLFAERLQKAADILESGYVKYPHDPNICRTMLTVELGQGKGKGRMEMWFQRAIEADPDNFETYKAKQYYLTSRWYGSDEEGFEFGLECVKTQNWTTKLPMILPIALSDTAEHSPKVYTYPRVWDAVEPVYRTYLEQHPQNTHYRSMFAKAAAQGEHWGIALEQFKILGHGWDHNVFERAEYIQLKRAAEAHANDSKTTP